MQKSALKEKPVTASTQSLQTIQTGKETFLHFSLLDVLPSNHTLVINSKLGTLAYITVEEDRAWLQGEQQFTASEMSILLPLLESFPFHCPYELLFAHFYHDNVTEQLITRARKHLQKAQEEGVWDQEMRSMRTMLSRLRLKIRRLGLDVSAILETGYILRVVSAPRSA